jgi:acrylyl-CoA reductase (NADPH)
MKDLFASTMADKFKALLLTQENGKTQAKFEMLENKDLPAGDVLISVKYSSLNYKDALAVTGEGRIVRKWPMVPGIDFAGVVEESSSSEFKAGDQVLATGYGLGEDHWGGYSEKVRVPAEWLVPLPKGLSLKQAMGIGTAGFTAMISVMALELHEIRPEGLPLVVTGAAGGVGSISVVLLSKLGYKVVASTGRQQEHEYLKSLGASEIIDRKVLGTPSDKALDRERWGGGIDSVGGDTLVSLFRSTTRDGAIAVCGLAGGNEIKTTVYPFILRGVSLIGISSIYTPMKRRREAWERLTKILPLNLLDSMITTVSLSDLPKISWEMIKGKVRGRTVVEVKA